MSSDAGQRPKQKQQKQQQQQEEQQEEEQEERPAPPIPPRRRRTSSSSSSSGRRSAGSATPSINVMSLLFFGAGVFAVVAALLARSGFTGRDHVIGIDLGTTYSVVGISQKNKVTIIPDASGHLIIPSMVAFLPDGAILVGRDARAYRTKDPKHTIFNAKRFIGRSYVEITQEIAAENEKQRIMRQAQGGAMTASNNNDVAFPYEFSLSSSTEDAHGAACFQLSLPGHPECVTPISIGGMIINHLKSMAEKFVGHQLLTKAVIAVPVDFKTNQRIATIQAFEAAGLKVARVLEEPTAAAIAYGLHQDPSVNFILVFDFGGGTLDVSLLFAREGSINVVDTLGDNHLGGEDVDAMVAHFLTRQVQEQLGVTSLASTMAATSSFPATDAEHDDHDQQDHDAPRHDFDAQQLDSLDINELPCTPAGIRRAAELVKRELSSQLRAQAQCFVVDTAQQKEEAKTPRKRVVTMTMARDQFNALCEPLFERTLVPVKRILQDNGMSSHEIDEVVLVGGSSRIPWIRQKLTQMFGGKPPRSDIDPDVAVAYGAAKTLD